MSKGVVMKSTSVLVFAITACLILPSIKAQTATASQKPSPDPAAQADVRGVPSPALGQPGELPQTPLPPAKRGDVYMARKMYREAIDAYREALENSPVLWNKIGIAYHQMMDLNAARKHYENALRLDPDYAEARNNLGAVYYARKNYKRAIKEYNKALKINPNSASVYSNLGTAYFARKKYKDAFEAYQTALRLDPDVFEHRSTYGTMLQERTVEERATYHYYLARTYAQAGMNDRALLYIRMSLEEGFKERKKYMEEPEFAALRELPEFQELMLLEPRVL
jgi:tetratricopeptide (TPR) repeat protein